MKGYICWFIWLLFFVQWGIQAQNDVTEIRSHFTQGMDLIKSAKYEEAFSHWDFLTKWLENDPPDELTTDEAALIYWGVGVCYYHMLDCENAGFYLNKSRMLAVTLPSGGMMEYGYASVATKQMKDYLCICGFGEEQEVLKTIEQLGYEIENADSKGDMNLKFQWTNVMWRLLKHNNFKSFEAKASKTLDLFRTAGTFMQVGDTEKALSVYDSLDVFFERERLLEKAAVRYEPLAEVLTIAHIYGWIQKSTLLMVRGDTAEASILLEKGLSFVEGFRMSKKDFQNIENRDYLQVLYLRFFRSVYPIGGAVGEVDSINYALESDYIYSFYLLSTAQAFAKKSPQRALQLLEKVAKIEATLPDRDLRKIALAIKLGAVYSNFDMNKASGYLSSDYSIIDLFAQLSGAEDSNTGNLFYWEILIGRNNALIQSYLSAENIGLANQENTSMIISLMEIEWNNSVYLLPLHSKMQAFANGIEVFILVGDYGNALEYIQKLIKIYQNKPILFKQLAFLKKHQLVDYLDFIIYKTARGSAISTSAQLLKNKLETIEVIKPEKGVNNIVYNYFQILQNNTNDQAKEQALSKLESTLKGIDYQPFYKKLHAQILVDLGDICLSNGHPEAAKEAYTKAFKLQKKWAVPYLGMAAYWGIKKEFQKASDAYDQGVTYAIQDIHSTYILLPKKIRSFFYTVNTKPVFDRICALGDRHKTQLDTKKTANFILNAKSISALAIDQINNEIKLDSSFAMLNTFLKGAHQDLAFAYTLPPAVVEWKFGSSIEHLEQRYELLEHTILYAKSLKISANIGDFSNYTPLIEYDIIRSKLKKKEAAIDFFHYTQMDTVWYGACILKANTTTPVIVRLCTAKELSNALSGAVKRTSDGGYNPSYISTDSINHKVYRLIVEPLDKYLIGIKNIHIAPDGQLYECSLSALKAPETTVPLQEKYQLHYYTTLRDFANKNNQKTLPERHTAYLFGGANFDMEADQMLEYELEEFKRLGRMKTRDLSEHWGTLEGSRKEVEGIAAIFKNQSLANEVALCVGDSAQENLLVDLIQEQPPTVLHLATHGFFAPKLSYKIDASIELKMLKDRLYFSLNPLMRSGFLLAGANYTWQGGVLPFGVADGIITAYDVSNWDLSNTHLVVLAACQTGRGVVDNLEGIQGLRSAFKQAGAEYLLVSLWNIGDDSTIEMMELFYERYVNGKTPPQAFEEALMLFKKKYPDPYYWGAFMLIE